MTLLHQERFWTRLATHLLTAGAELAYGGDLRDKGYTWQLVDLLRAAMDAGQDTPRDRLHWYVTWPLVRQLDNTDVAVKIPKAIKKHLHKRPSGLEIEDAWIPITDKMTPEARFAWTLGGREMRSAMAEECHARVMVGGQLQSVSAIPGLVEEFLTFAERGKPLYLIGAFGGMTGVIIRALRGERPEELSQAFQDGAGGERKVIREYHDQQVATGRYPGLAKIDFPSIVARLNGLGLDSLKNNGLSPEENERLMATRDPVEMVSLVLYGLENCFKSS
jgi:hypothetical protein